MKTLINAQIHFIVLVEWNGRFQVILTGPGKSLIHQGQGSSDLFQGGGGGGSCQLTEEGH